MVNAQFEKSFYTDSELEEFKAKVEQKLLMAKAKMETYREQILEESSDAKPRNVDDGATISNGLEVLTEMYAREEKLIGHLQNALARIANKSYGICKATGRLIPRERLLAMPHATMCIEAKQQPSR